MSLGSWDPQAETAAHNIRIEADTLERLAGYSRNGQLEALEQLIAGDDSQTLSGLMHLDHDQWRQAAAGLDDDSVLHLVRFFAVAENLPGWEAGEKSPVIPLAKVLRGRGQRLDKDFLVWLRSVSENRFLPYGPL